METKSNNSTYRFIVVIGTLFTLAVGTWPLALMFLLVMLVFRRPIKNLID